MLTALANTPIFELPVVAEPVFRIRTSLRAMAPRVAGGPQLLRPGMTVTGKILVERRSLWAALFGWGEKGPA